METLYYLTAVTWLLMWCRSAVVEAACNTTIPCPKTGVPGAVCCPSPNYRDRGKSTVEYLILHHTAGSDVGSLQTLTDITTNVSAHYLVFRNGTLYQLVDETKRAYHAGISRWKNTTSSLNSNSIGIEISHEKQLEYTDAQIVTVIAACRNILSRYASIKPENVLGHSDIQPFNKSEDPGVLFPWQRLYENGVGHWVVPEPVNASDSGIGSGATGDTVSRLQKQLIAYGYGWLTVDGVYGTNTATVVSAFQSHFRSQRVDGRADDSSIKTLDRLLSALNPVVDPWPRPGNLVGFWPLSSETKLTDVGPRKLHGSTSNTVYQATTGPFATPSTAAQKTSADILYVNGGSKVSLTGSFTVSFFFKPSSTSSGLFSFGKDDKKAFQLTQGSAGSGPVGSGLYLQIFAYGVLAQQFPLFDKGVWTFISITFDKNSSKLAAIGRHGQIAIPTISDQVRLGIASNKEVIKTSTINVDSNRAVGLTTGDAISCLSVYDTALTTAEISQLYDACRIMHGSVSCGAPKLPLSPFPAAEKVPAIPQSGQFPWIVSIQYKSKHRCAGTIIDPYWVLTWAFCLTIGDQYIMQPDISVVIGAHDLNVSSEGRKVRNVYTYLFSSGLNAAKATATDLALVMLVDPIDMTSNYVNDACLNYDGLTESLTQNARCYVYGWGDKGRPSQVSQSLPRYTAGDILSDSECKSAWGSDFRTGSSICFRTTGNDQSVPCNGDEGTPLLRTGNANVPFAGIGDRLIQIGIYYKRDSTCSASKPGLFISLASHSKWIKETLACAVPSMRHIPLGECPYGTRRP